MDQALRIGLVGGGIGRQHIDAYQALSDRFAVTAVCDIDAAKAQHVAEQYGIPRVLTDFGDLCRADEVDVIDICTPSFLHAAQAAEALRAGKHVICEKPVAGSLQDIDRLIDLEQQAAGTRLMPIFQYRFGHGVQQLRLLRAQGLTGSAYLTTVETAWRRRAEYYAAPWRGKWETELGGAVLTLAVHAHDILSYVLGPIKSVFARTTTRVNPIETEDCMTASLEMADGSLASLAVTTGSSEQISRHRFCFQNLTAESNTDAYNNTAAPWTFTADSPELKERIRTALEVFTPLPERFEGQFLRFSDAVRQGEELPVTLHDARASLELMTAIYASARTGEAVTLPLDSDHPLYAGWQP